MAGIATPHASQKHTLVFVQPEIERRWEVVMEGHLRSVRFADRERALSYAQIWAAVNRPSTVLVYGARGDVEHEWTFDVGGRFKARAQ